MPTEVYTTIAP